MSEAPDAAARRRALDPARSFLVVAPAGSGKTSLLTLRLLTLLARVEEPEAVVAITFTRKAAEEMRGRVLEALAAAAETPAPDAHRAELNARARAVLAQDARCGWRLREQPQRLRIQTIDALAAALARRVPLLSALALGSDVREDAAALYAEAARATLVELTDDPRWAPPLTTLLAHLDNDWDRLEALLASMLARRDQWLRLVAPGADRAALERALTGVVEGALGHLRRAIGPSLAADLAGLADTAGRVMQGREPDSPLCCLAGLPRLPGASAADLGRWRALAGLMLTAKGEPRKALRRSEGVPAEPAAKADFLARHAAACAALAEQPALCAALHATRALPPVRYEDGQWRALGALFEVLKLAAARLALCFADHRCCDFVEVSRAALAALGEADAPTDLTLALDHRIEHLLVDEFQDTSVTQALLLERLLAGWSGEDGRTVFLVGDPRQSIYRFRQAEVQLFNDTAARGRFAGVPLERLQLTANFRTVAPLIERLNALLPAVFAEGDPMGAMPPLAATRAGGGAAALGVHPVPLDDPPAQAACVLELVRAARSHNPQATVAVLVRSRAQLALIPAQLAAAGIPVHAVDLDPLSVLPLVNDLMALTRALLATTDRTAWLAILRAPWSGLPLGAIAALTEGDPHGLVWEALQDPARRAALPGADRDRVQRLCAVLGPALALRGRCGVAELVEATWLALGGAACAAGDGRYARRFFELLARHEAEEGDLSPAGLEACIARHYAPLPALEGAPVSVMTIHRAKGLEFDVVILPALERVVKAEPRRLLLWHEPLAGGGGGQFLFAPLPEPGRAAEPIYDYLRGEERAALDAEASRLLYVALTRARETLHLVPGLAWDAAGDACPPGRGSFLHRLWPVLAPDLAEPASPTAPAVAVRPPLPRVRLAPGPPPCAPAVPAGPEEERVAFEWAQPTARHIGTVAHLGLQLIGREGLEAWAPDGRLAALAPFVRGQLRARGLAPAEVAAAAEQVLAALDRVLASERGRWIFSPEHTEAASEHALTAMLHGTPTEAVIDRTFVDRDGTRWIIDFKTGTHEGAELDAFLDAEVERYRPQLARYARVLDALESRPTRLALYYPLLDGWREWPA